MFYIPHELSSMVMMSVSIRDVAVSSLLFAVSPSSSTTHVLYDHASRCVPLVLYRLSTVIDSMLPLW